MQVLRDKFFHQLRFVLLLLHEGSIQRKTNDVNQSIDGIWVLNIGLHFNDLIQQGFIKLLGGVVTHVEVVETRSEGCIEYEGKGIDEVVLFEFSHWVDASVGSDFVFFGEEGLADEVPVVEGDFSDFVNELLLFFSNLSFRITIPMIIKQHNILP